MSGTGDDRDKSDQPRGVIARVWDYTMGPLQQSFEKMGIDSRDVTMAIVAFNAGLYVSYVATKFGRETHAALQRYPRYVSFETGVVRNAEKLGNYRLVSAVRGWLGQDSQQFVTSLAETSVMYNALFPVWFYAGKCGLKTYFGGKRPDDDELDTTQVSDSGGVQETSSSGKAAVVL